MKIRSIGSFRRIVHQPTPKRIRKVFSLRGAKVFGLTAGLPVTLQGLAGGNGKIWGLESFGFSAPYKVLDEKLGFTAENVYNQVKSMLQ